MSRPRKVLDLLTVERDYRTGSASMREIARRTGVSERSIRRRVREGGWSQDLVARTNAMVAKRIACHASPEGYAAVLPVVPHDPFARTREDEFVAEASAQKFAVIERQKDDIARHLEIHRSHLDAVEVVMERALASASDDLQSIRTLVQCAKLIDTASTTLARLIPLEARVYAIDYVAIARMLEPSAAKVVILPRPQQSPGPGRGSP